MLLVISFLVSFLLLFTAGLLVFHRSEVAERLRTIVGGRPKTSARLWENLLKPAPETFTRITKPFENLLPRNPAALPVLQKKLIRAGYRQTSAVNVFYGSKILVPLALCVLVSATGLYRFAPLFLYVLAAGVGFVLPGIWLGRRISRRQSRIRAGLPEALDLMVVCSEAGLGLDQAMYRVSDELRLTQPQIADELKLTILEQNAGRPRNEALNHLAGRVGIDLVGAFTNTLIQADTMGTGIAKSLRAYSETLRIQRRQNAEELAAKTTVKLVFPLVFFIFPSIFVVTIGPSVVNLCEEFTRYF